ncbi:hypothetical protein [Pelotomaculum propionicicum]|uniref:hypothetical protein n=1 Tax=Pelotomaculum propionicicum TaxID=258475 RepID=UPI003B9E6466
MDLERIEKIEITEDLPTIWDFQQEGMTFDWSRAPELDFKGGPTEHLEFLTSSHRLSRTNVRMTLYKDREKAAEGYLFYKNFNHNRTQFEKVINANDAYCISKVKRMREEDLAGLVKMNQYLSEVVFVKNNLVVSIYSYYDDNTGSDKQVVIDIVADYLEKKAAKEKTL